jgi:polyisoprenoid-binding protein YceI
MCRCCSMRPNNLLINTYLGVFSLVLLSGCVSQQDIPAQQKPPIDFPSSIYTEDETGSVYQVDSRASQILISVRRGGIMASLGHDHIVASKDLQGYIFLDSNSSQNPNCRADFYAPIANLEVDNAELRSAANLSTSPSAKDIAGTTSNMLKSVEAADFPFARLHSSDCLRALSGEQSEVVLTIHGVDQQRNVAIDIEEVSENKIILSGEFSVPQSDFGIQPFSIMNGLIKVEDRLELSYRIVALKKLTRE